jgi:CBS domain containing-hemolysin-like protein
MALDILLTAFLVFLNGFFVAAEFAIVKVRASQIELLAKKGDRIAGISKRILRNMDAYLSACQLGITIASLALGWIGEPVVAKLVLNTFGAAGIPLEPDTAHGIAIPIAFVLITVMHIVFGEQAPKSYAIHRPEATTRWISIPLNVFYLVFKPIIWGLNGLATLTLRLAGLRSPQGAELHSPEELKFMVEEGKKGGIIEAGKSEIIRNAFDFAERTARQAMVPRTYVFGVNRSSGVQEALDKIIENGYTRVPVFEGTIDHIVGIIFTKDLLAKLRGGGEFTLQDIMRTPYYISGHKKLIDIMRDFQKEHIQFAIVIDEFGGTEGVITMEDILEELVGEIQDEYDSEVPAFEKLEEKKFRAQGSITLVDLNELLPRPLPEDQRYVTLAGLIISQAGRIPTVGDKVNYQDYTMTVVKRIKNQIILVEIDDRVGAEVGR